MFMNYGVFMEFVEILVIVDGNRNPFFNRDYSEDRREIVEKSEAERINLNYHKYDDQNYYYLNYYLY